MSPSERNRNNVRAGVFVTISIVLGMAIFVVLTDALAALGQSTHEYIVTFDVASGVSNLKEGSEVRVGGVALGKVLAISPKLEEGKAFREIDVRFKLDRRVTIYSDAVVLVSAPLIGAEAWLDIPNVGNPEKGKPTANHLAGAAAVGMLTNLLGGDSAVKAGELVENTTQFSRFLAELPQEFHGRIYPVIDDLHATSADLRLMVGDLRQAHWPMWAQSVDELMSWTSTATSGVDELLVEGKGLVGDGREILAENRSNVQSLVSNLQSASERLNSETLDKLHALLDTGRQGLDEAVLALEDLRVDYAGWAENIGEALAGANLAAQQLKLTTIETRRSPWKLLYRPTADELEHELLYEAARSFAVAAADLKAASESVRRVLDNHGDKIADRQDAYVRIEQHLLSSLEKYEKAQQQLLDVLIVNKR